ncbi:C40 family peptidase [Corynebacterium sp. NPDC060344]|uniref:C40 family peptidase n=1 Tax=Corynebacterium sp. NPDC060344 TaxID=3347101 RepID=UPI003662441B
MIGAFPVQDVVKLVSSAVPALAGAGAGAVPAAVPAAVPGFVDDWWGVADAVAGQWTGGAGEAAAESLRRAATGAGTLDGHATGIDSSAAEGMALIAAAAVDLAGVAAEFLAKCAGTASGAAGAGPAAPLLAAADMQTHAVEALAEAGGRVSRLDADLAAPTSTLESVAAADVDIPDAPTTPMTPAMAQVGGVGAGGSGAGGSGSGESGAENLGAGSGVGASAGDGAPTPQARAAVDNALSQLGTPYQWGGTTPGVGLDCSGLTQWAYGQAGVDIPRTAAEQAVGRPVDASELLPGDLVVWDGHVAMVIGDGQMVEAGDPVQVNPIRTTNMNMGFQGFWRPTG